MIKVLHLVLEISFIIQTLCSAWKTSYRIFIPRKQKKTHKKNCTWLLLHDRKLAALAHGNWYEIFQKSWHSWSKLLKHAMIDWSPSTLNSYCIQKNYAAHFIVKHQHLQTSDSFYAAHTIQNRSDQDDLNSSDMSSWLVVPVSLNPPSWWWYFLHLLMHLPYNTTEVLIPISAEV